MADCRFAIVIEHSRVVIKSGTSLYMLAACVLELADRQLDDRVGMHWLQGSTILHRVFPVAFL